MIFLAYDYKSAIKQLIGVVFATHTFVKVERP